MRGRGGRIGQGWGWRLPAPRVPRLGTGPALIWSPGGPRGEAQRLDVTPPGVGPGLRGFQTRQRDGIAPRAPVLSLTFLSGFLKPTDSTFWVRCRLGPHGLSECRGGLVALRRVTKEMRQGAEAAAAGLRSASCFAENTNVMKSVVLCFSRRKDFKPSSYCTVEIFPSVTLQSEGHLRTNRNRI